MSHDRRTIGMTGNVTPFRKQRSAIESRSVALQAASGPTTVALQAIASAARSLLDSRQISEMDEVELLATVHHFNCIGTWLYSADAALTYALAKARDGGRLLEPIDLARLENIERRALDAATRVAGR